MLLLQGKRGAVESLQDQTVEAIEAVAKVGLEWLSNTTQHNQNHTMF